MHAAAMGRGLPACLFASATQALRQAQCLGALTLVVGLPDGRGDAEALAAPSGGRKDGVV